MNAKHTSIALALITIAAGQAAMAQCLQSSCPATVTGTRLQASGCPTVTSSQVIPVASNNCLPAVIPAINSYAAIAPAPAMPLAGFEAPRPPAIELQILGLPLFGFGCVPRNADMR